MHNLQTIQRIEKKYLMSAQLQRAVLQEIAQYIQPDIYPHSRIFNLYLDDERHSLLYYSMQKECFKEKLRLRSYQPLAMHEDGEVFLEIKKKYNHVVCKRRLECSLQNALAFIKGERSCTSQIEKELAYALQYHQADFRIYVAYERDSYVGIEEADLRITFDYNIRGRCDQLSLQDEGNVKPLLEEGYVMMEIKAHKACPLWLVKVLSKYQLYPCSFSKVGKIYEQHIRTGGV